MSKKVKDLVGQSFGKLKVIEYIGKNKNNNHLWLCECSCEKHNQVIVTRNALKSGNTKSCGCLRKGNLNSKKHGLRYTRIYHIWSNMIERCYNENNKDYKNYGGRGISICDEWKNDVVVFWEWAKNNGYNENLSIDRIDANGNYEPSNCRWATNKEQISNRRNTRTITYNGKTQTIKQWSDEFKINYNTLIDRIDRYNWDLEKALTTPAKKQGA